jgi:hypothetical protein
MIFGRVQRKVLVASLFETLKRWQLSHWIISSGGLVLASTETT